jgi:hypothetical protein
MALIVSIVCAEAGKLPSYEGPPRPALNRPFGTPWEREGAVR